MKANVTYRMGYIPHPWDEKRRREGIELWCLIKVITPEIGNGTEVAVAAFNLDSEAETFQGNVYAEGLDGKLVSISSDQRVMFERRLGRR